MSDMLTFRKIKNDYVYLHCLIDQFFKYIIVGGHLPFGQVPVLEVDGKVLAQSMAIFKYVARETGFSPSDSFELAKADMIVDGLIDVRDKAMKFAFEKDEEKKKDLAKPFYEKDLPDALVIFEKLLKANDAKHFAGKKMSYADILFFGYMDGLFQGRKEDIPPPMNHFPLLKDLFSRVAANPGIKEWLNKRPVTPM